MATKTTYSRRYVTVCREGWYYLFVLAFIAGGAILRQVNPLFALAAVMIAPMLFNWRISMTSINPLRFRRKLPERISAGEHLTIDIEATNQLTRFDSFTVHVQDRITLIDPPLREYRSVAECMLARIPAGKTARTSYRCYLNRRGRYRLGPMRFSTRFPVGLIRASRAYRHQDELVVAPRIGALTPAWTNLVFRNQTGTQQTISRQGTLEGNFYAMRQWRSGDSKRWVHWRTTARTGQLMVKQYEQQSERDLTLILDAWQPEEPNDEQLDRVELAASFVATAIMQSFHEAAGHITLAIAGRESICLSSQSTTGFLNEVLTQLATAQAVPNSDLREAVSRTAARASTSSRIAIISTRELQPEQVIHDDLSATGIDVENLLGRLILIDVSQTAKLEQLFAVS